MNKAAKFKAKKKTKRHINTSMTIKYTESRTKIAMLIRRNTEQVHVLHELGRAGSHDLQELMGNVVKWRFQHNHGVNNAR